MKKGFIILLMVLTSQAHADCERNYMNTMYLGCTIQKGDKILNSKWASSVINNYSGNVHQGTTYFEVDGKGNYKGLTVIRNPNENCVRLNFPGWSGKVYKIEENTYAAWNTGTYDAFYLINMSNDGLIGTSHLIGGYNTAGVDERNYFFRRSKKFNFNNVLRIYEQFYCN